MTTLLWLAAGAAYLLIAIMIWRRAAWVFADRERFNSQLEPFTPFEIIWGLVVGAAFASVWPITVAIYLLRTRGLPFLGSRFLLPPSHIRLAQQSEQARERERRIAELERHTEISS